MASTAHELKMEIDERRAAIDQDLADLGEAASPANVAHRAATGAMDAVKAKVGGAGSRMVDGAGSTRDRLRHAPAAVRDHTADNPWGAGLAAFGIGLVAAALWPATPTERRMARTVEEQAKPLVAGVASDEAGALADELREPARDAVASVKERAAEATDAVTGGPGSPGDG